MQDLGIYIHIPFCVRKCLYCDFLSFPMRKQGAEGAFSPSDPDLMRLYAEALRREIRSYSETARGRTVDSVFLGGGTPSLMPPGALEDIFRELYDDFDISSGAEITMEMNPGTVDDGILSFSEKYLNRASLGVQSFEDDELKRIGRIHTAAEADASFRKLRDAGIRNINIDLMYGLPGQSVGSFGRTLDHLLELSPEHVSAYSLIIEEGTPFGALAEEGSLSLPDEDEEREMADLAERRLTGKGSFEHYEISNFAKDGFRCRHNVRYWKRGDYLGFGLGAASLFENERWSNTRDLAEYLKRSDSREGIVRGKERLSQKSSIEEFMFLGLRMTDGVSCREFRDEFHLELTDIYGKTLEKHIEEGLMTRSGDRFALTHRGMDVSNPVMADYLLDP